MTAKPYRGDKVTVGVRHRKLRDGPPFEEALPRATYSDRSGTVFLVIAAFYIAATLLLFYQYSESTPSVVVTREGPAQLP
jgi:hypothetical protein